MATIDSHYFKVCTRGAKRKGIDTAALYAQAGIKPELLTTPGARESIEKMAVLVRSIGKAMNDECMGFIPTPIRGGSFAIMTEYAYHSETVLEAIQKGLAFYRLFTDDIVAALDEGDDGVLTLTSKFRRPKLDPDHYFMEFWLILWHRLACWFAGETIPLLAAEFSYPRPQHYFDEFNHLFPCKQTFNADECRMHFHAADFLTPVRRSKKELTALIAKAPLDLMTIPASDRSMSRKVYVVLRPWETGVFKARTADEVAAQIGISSTVMRRALRDEGTSFQRICEEIRSDLACSKLRASQDSIESITADLGYLETRSFTRAFRHWTGMSPSEFRRLKIPD